ncbi:MAG TPA: sigma-70 family RNA polymerase sigma factor [bacterium]
MDQATMAAFSARREQRISEAIRSYGKRLSGFIRRRVPSDEDAEDILQDVWLQLSSVVDLDPIQRLSAWLFRVARNRIADKHRKKKALPVSAVSHDADDDIPAEESLFIDPQTPEDEVLRRLFYEELNRALEELPAPQRQVFILNEIEGLTFEEISQRTGENIKTLISRKRYAVKKLRARLSDLNDDLSGDS